jgi:hypothetical protein
VHVNPGRNLPEELAEDRTRYGGGVECVVDDQFAERAVAVADEETTP